ncbi:UvrD-helicase domain-containing protein [Propionivibrio dicarboxylicus]|nr:UvrD-helicase domain-containing protein [Propionivibrio dicarboxylicus]
MGFKPSFFGKLFTRSDHWTLVFSGDTVVIQAGATGIATIPLPSIQTVSVQKGLFWATVRLNAESSVVTLRGVSRGQSIRLQNELRKVISQALSRLAAPSAQFLTSVIANLEALYEQPRYLANRDLHLWGQSQASENLEIRKLIELLKHPYFDKALLPRDLESDIQRLQDVLTGQRLELARRNERFVANEMKRLKPFFDAVESQPLTDEQQRAAIVSEDRSLLIAAAGSGKSSTVVAKIGYALETGFCSPAQILALAFNKTAAEELDTRISTRLAAQLTGRGSVTSRTFHRLGLDIIAAVEGKKPDLAPWANETRDSEGSIVEELIHTLATTDRSFLEKWVTFQAVCFRPNKELPRFQTRQDYDAYLRQVGEERDGHKGIRSLNGELVKSMEEVAIANWLFMNGIPYEYERTYEYDTADQQHRQYHPDFYFSDIDSYHEHFALDDNGKAPAIFKGDYEEGVRWKRMLHSEKHTDLIETTSAMYRAGTLFRHLEAELRTRGQQFKPRSPQEVLARLAELKLPSYGGFIRTFMTLCKSGGLSPVTLAEKANSQRDRYRARAFLDVVVPVFQAYEAKLAELRCIDFEDMIRTATSYVREGKFKHPYQLILVDEFQDIAHGRAQLVLAMLTQNPDCRLFAVGDDWQSIYRFTGSDIGIMANFAHHFGVTATNYLTRTFRSNQGITDVAASFIQANPSQLKKAVQAIDTAKEATIQILEYGADDDVEAVLAAELETLAGIAQTEQRSLRIFLLGRYNHLRPGSLTSWQKRYAGALTIQFLSLHRSKGLEADYVFLLGVISGPYSFPSEIVDDPLLDLVLPVPETFEYSEERRLFYVGLTRAKRRTYVLTKKSRVSRFVQELLKPHNRGTVIYRSGKASGNHPEVEPCPACGTGVLRVINGQYGPFMACSNYPDCSEKKKLNVARTRR